MKLDVDGARGFVIDNLCNDLLKIKDKTSIPPEEGSKVKQIVVRLLDSGLSSIEKYILEIKQTLCASLVLYKIVLMKDKNFGVLGIISDKALQESIRKKYLEPISNIVQIVLEEKEVKDEKGESIKLPAQLLEAYKKDKHQIEVLRFLIADINSVLAVPPTH